MNSSLTKNFIRSFYEKQATKWMFIFLVAVISILLYKFDVFERVELATIDYRFILRSPQTTASNIVFIDMEEDSVKAIGRWPWPRKWHATLVRILSEYNPKLIAFDVIFSEDQDDLNDKVFEEAIKESGIVYLPLSYTVDVQDHKQLEAGGKISSILKPLQSFQKQSKGSGHLNAFSDSDGILRRVPPIINYKNQKSYQFGFKIGYDALGISDKDVKFYPEEHRILLERNSGEVIEVPLDEDNQLIINWRDKWGKAFKHFSYIDVISSYALMEEGKDSPIDFSVFKDKICIIGLTASGLLDIRPIPIERSYPAVGANATVINNVVNRDFIRTTSKKTDILILIFISIFITLCLSKLRFLNGAIFAIISMLAYAAVSIVIFNLFNVLIITSYSIAAIFISHSLIAGYAQVVQSIEKMRLVHQATRDGLTHLYNVRHFNILLEAEFKNLGLYKTRPLSLVMSDVDNFKSINDTYGHQAGDMVLKMIAKTLQSEARQSDIVARYGGEEFIIALIGTNGQNALKVAERIRAAIEKNEFEFKNKEVHVTISMGISEFSDEKTKEELIEKADKTLYRAKQSGKNRVEMYS